MNDQEKVFKDPRVDDITTGTGVIDERDALSIDEVDDATLVRRFKYWVNDSEAYWNSRSGFNLRNVRAQNERYYLGKQDSDRLYYHQADYRDNQLFVGIQAVIAYVSARDPGCEITPGDDSPASKTLASRLESAVDLHSQKVRLSRKIKVAAKNLALKRVGVIKLMYNPFSKEIEAKALNPEKVILDRNAELDEEPRFICEVCEDTVDILMSKFPEKEKEIMAELGFVRKTQKLLSTVVAYNEIWFTDTTTGEPRECVAWYFNNLILDKKLSPMYEYDNKGVAICNYTDKPTKPYTFCNYLNDGSHMVDQTSPIEQAIPLQNILNRRGRQIIDNADTANSIKVFRSGAISEDDAKKLTGKPNQSVVLDIREDEPISNAYGEIPAHLLPNYVLQDKEDIKNSIHNILGTPSQFRGDDSKRDVGTLGEAQMMQSQASGRQDEIVREIDNMLDRYFKLLVQMMKVYYAKNHKISGRDTDGNFIHVELSRETIPDNAVIAVSPGSTVSMDKSRRENIAVKLAELGVIDPYNLFKDLGLKDSSERYESLVKFKTDPNMLVDEVRSEVQDEEAYIDFAVIMNGFDAKPRDDVTPEHILAHNKQLQTDKFLMASPKLQQKLLAHIDQEVLSLSQREQLQAASDQGLLVDPSIPTSPDIPQPQPEMPADPSQIPPELLQGQQPPVEGPPIPEQPAQPVGDLGGVQDQGTSGILSGLGL